MPAIASLHGLAAPLVRDNIDTDVIIASRDITSPTREGLGEKLFGAWRFHPGDGREIPDFILNRPPWKAARILLAGRNFGCGSSREMAVWALQQFGIACVIAPSFGAIFRGNSLRNGLITIELPVDQVQELAEQAATGELMLDIDIKALKIKPRLQGEDLPPLCFEMNLEDQEMLLSGRDAIDRALEHRAAIEAFEARDLLERPWVRAVQTDAAAD